MIQYFFCFLLSIASFGYTSSIEECSCNEPIETVESENDIVGTDLVVI